ncbi:MAG: ABC transporter permease [Chloroflexota bacterium]|nr:ABC transporter permease [Chloroflexota bacterium]
MQAYVARRLLLMIPTIFGVTVLIFLAMRVLPGDPLAAIAGEGQVYVLSKEELQAVRRSLGIDRPLYQQYMSWMADVFRGKLGYSFWRDKDPIINIINRRLPITAQIAVMATIIALVIGLPVGLIAALRRNSWLDYLVRFIVTLFMAIPSFWLGLTFILITVLFFSWKPPIENVYFWDSPWRNFQLTIGPAVALGVGFGAIIARMSRATLLEVFREDYVRTARAKGLSERTVTVRHALRNSLLPVLTLSGTYFGAVMGGTVAVERAFGVHGLGFTLIYAIYERDWMVIQNLALLFAVIYVLVNLSVDLAYAWIDPRVRYQ